MEKQLLNIWYYQVCASEKYGEKEKNMGRHLLPPFEPNDEFKKIYQNTHS